MEYQKIINLSDNTPNQPTKFRTKNRIEINDESRGNYDKDDQIKFKTSMLRSSLCDYSDAYILAKGAICNTAAQDQTNNAANRKVMLNNCAPFTNCISRINNTQVDDATNIDVVMPMYNLMEYSDNYSETFGILWQFYRDVWAVDNNGAIVDFNMGNSNTRSFNLKIKLTVQKGSNGTKKIK